MFCDRCGQDVTVAGLCEDCAYVLGLETRCMDCGATTSSGRYCIECRLYRQGRREHVCTECGAEVTRGRAYCQPCRQARRIRNFEARVPEALRFAVAADVGMGWGVSFVARRHGIDREKARKIIEYFEMKGGVLEW